MRNYNTNRKSGKKWEKVVEKWKNSIKKKILVKVKKVKKWKKNNLGRIHLRYPLDLTDLFAFQLESSLFPFFSPPYYPRESPPSE